jgi:hypothetical protein
VTARLSSLNQTVVKYNINDMVRDEDSAKDCDNDSSQGGNHHQLDQIPVLCSWPVQIAKGTSRSSCLLVMNEWQKEQQGPPDIIVLGSQEHGAVDHISAFQSRLFPAGEISADLSEPNTQRPISTFSIRPFSLTAPHISHNGQCELPLAMHA